MQSASASQALFQAQLIGLQSSPYGGDELPLLRLSNRRLRDKGAAVSPPDPTDPLAQRKALAADVEKTVAAPISSWSSNDVTQIGSASKSSIRSMTPSVSETPLFGLCVCFTVIYQILLLGSEGH